MALVAFGPGFDGIGHVGSEQSRARVVFDVVDGALGVACHEGSAKGVEGGAIPEGLAAGLGEHTVACPQAWRIECVEGALGMVEDAHGEGYAYP